MSGPGTFLPCVFKGIYQFNFMAYACPSSVKAYRRCFSLRKVAEFQTAARGGFGVVGVSSGGKPMDAIISTGRASSDWFALRLSFFCHSRAPVLASKQSTPSCNVVLSMSMDAAATKTFPDAYAIQA